MTKSEFAKKVAARSGTKGVPFWMNATSGLGNRGVKKDEVNAMVAVAREWVKLPINERFDLRAKLDAIVTTIETPEGFSPRTKDETIEWFINFVW